MMNDYKGSGFLESQHNVHDEELSAVIEQEMVDKEMSGQLRLLFAGLKECASSGSRDRLLEDLRAINARLSHYRKFNIHDIYLEFPICDFLESLIIECPYSEICFEVLGCIFLSMTCDSSVREMFMRSSTLTAYIIDALDRFGSDILHPCRVVLEELIHEYDMRLVSTAYRIIGDREGDSREFYVDMAFIFWKMLTYANVEDKTFERNVETFVEIFFICLSHNVFEYVLDAILLLSDHAKVIPVLTTPPLSDPNKRVILDLMIDGINAWQNIPIQACQYVLRILIKLLREKIHRAPACANGLNIPHVMELIQVPDVQNLTAELFFTLCEGPSEVVRRCADFSFIEEMLHYMPDAPFQCRRWVMQGIAKLIIDEAATNQNILWLASDTFFANMDEYLEDADDERVLRDMLVVCIRLLRVDPLKPIFRRRLGHHFCDENELRSLREKLNGDQAGSSFLYLISNALQMPPLDEFS